MWGRLMLASETYSERVIIDWNTVARMQGSGLAHWVGECKFRNKSLVRRKGRTWRPQNRRLGEEGGRLGSHTSWKEGMGVPSHPAFLGRKNDGDFPQDKYTAIRLTRARSGTFKPLLGIGPSFSNVKTNFTRPRCWLKSSPEARTQPRRAWPRNALRRLPLSRWQRAQAGSLRRS